MRNIIIYISFLLLASGAFSQSIYFNKVLTPYSGTNNLLSIVQIDSFFYALSIKIDTTNYWKNDIVLLKIDQQGNMVDTAVIEMPHQSYNTRFENLIKLEDGNLLACGATKDTSNIIFGYLFKFNTNLDTLWSKKYAHPDTIAASQPGADVRNLFHAVKQTYDGGFIIAGDYNKDCITGNYRSFLLKTDSLGGIQFFKKFMSYYLFTDIELAKDSGFFIPTTNNGTQGLVLLKTDKLGNIEWVRAISTYLNQNFPIGAVLLDSNNIVICSAHFSGISAYHRTLIVSKINLTTKSVVWEKEFFTFHDFVSYSLDQSISIRKSIDGNIIVGSTAIVPDSIITNPSRGFLLKINPIGDSLWMRNYGYGLFEDFCVLREFIETQDGSFLGIGYHYNTTTGYRDWIF